MRKLRLVKVVVPEIVAYITFNGVDKEPDYRCTNCGFAVSDNYIACPYCSSELDWKKVKTPTEKFIKFINEL